MSISDTTPEPPALDIYRKTSRFPKQVLIDTCSYCNLNCSMCARQFNPRKWGIMPEETAHHVIDQVCDIAPETRIWFCYFGEPLMMKNRGLFDRVKYAKDRGLQKAVINTNGNLMDEECIRKMIAAGMDEVYIGIDAADPETYASIRRKGNYETVLNNIFKLIELAGDRIRVTVQFGVYESNEHQVDDFRNFWSQYPVHIFIRPKLTWINYLEDHIKTSPGKRYPCPWIFDSLNVLENGDVPYCVCDWANQAPVGNVMKEPLTTLWQKKTRRWLLVHARRQWDMLPEFCRTCPDWQTKKPLDDRVIEHFSNDEPF